jgi:glycosyltransferase involved in cell wall biosynthesis
MKIVHLSATDLSGGAARAAYRLHRCITDIYPQHQSHMLVHYKSGDDKNVSVALRHRSLVFKLLYRARKWLMARTLASYKHKRSGWFSAQQLPSLFDNSAIPSDTDVVHLHWICGEYINIKSVLNIAQLGKPIVWTLHDMWAFTGGCHYDEGCGKYVQHCGACPHLGSDQMSDLSYRVLRQKQRYWQNLHVTLIAPSQWVSDCAKQSTLFKDAHVTVIHHGLDLAIYQPHHQLAARRALGLPEEKKLILFGAMNSASDKRKGFHLLLSALNQITTMPESQDYHLVVFGAKLDDRIATLRCHSLGHINDDHTLALAYASADVMVVPSLQETFGQTAAEAMACGTPVVAFDATGLRDVVDHKLSGYLATPFVADDLACGMRWVLNLPTAQSVALREQSRQIAVERFNLEQFARKHIALYENATTHRLIF